MAAGHLLNLGTAAKTQTIVNSADQRGEERDQVLALEDCGRDGRNGAAHHNITTWSPLSFRSHPKITVKY